MISSDQRINLLKDEETREFVADFDESDDEDLEELDKKITKREAEDDESEGEVDSDYDEEDSGDGEEGEIDMSGDEGIMDEDDDDDLGENTDEEDSSVRPEAKNQNGKKANRAKDLKAVRDRKKKQQYNGNKRKPTRIEYEIEPNTSAKKKQKINGNKKLRF